MQADVADAGSIPAISTIFINKYMKQTTLEEAAKQILLGEDNKQNISRFYKEFVESGGNFYDAVKTQFSKEAEYSGKYQEDDDNEIDFEELWEKMAQTRTDMARHLKKIKFL